MCRYKHYLHVVLERQILHNKYLEERKKIYKWKKNNQIYLPARIDAIAAIRKLRMIDGPAVSWATWPVKIYVPVPNVDPIPK